MMRGLRPIVCRGGLLYAGEMWGVKRACMTFSGHNSAQELKQVLSQRAFVGHRGFFPKPPHRAGAYLDCPYEY